MQLAVTISSNRWNKIRVKKHYTTSRSKMEKQNCEKTHRKRLIIHTSSSLKANNNEIRCRSTKKIIDPNHK